jgi:splicing factor 3A subunit 3
MIYTRTETGKIGVVIWGVQFRTTDILTIVESARSNEIAAISGAADNEFYRRLKAIKDYHRRYTNDGIEPMELEFLNRNLEEDEDVEAAFTGEEALGKYLDLNVSFEQYLNLKGVKREKMTYLAYLNEFDRFEDIAKETKSTPDYTKYVTHTCQNSFRCVTCC